MLGLNQALKLIKIAFFIIYIVYRLFDDQFLKLLSHFQITTRRHLPFRLKNCIFPIRDSEYYFCFLVIYPPPYNSL